MAHTAPSTDVMKSTLRGKVSSEMVWMSCMYDRHSQDVIGCELIGNLESVNEVGLMPCQLAFQSHPRWCTTELTSIPNVGIRVRI